MTSKIHIIYLIGFMGSGKTTAGIHLAKELGWSFIDLDKKIEEYTQKTITEIFSADGEGYFRSLETSLLGNMVSVTNTVISTGGGTPCHSSNMEFMLDTGLTIYLKLSPEQLKIRLSGSADTRPLIKNLDDTGLKTFIKEKLAEREKYYNRSHLIIEESNLDIDSLIAIVKSRLHI